MSDLRRFLDETSLFVNDSLNFLEIPSIRFILIILLILYTTALVPRLTQSLNEIFNNIFVKILMLLVIVYLGQKDPVLALLVGIAFIMSIIQTNQPQFGNNLLSPVPTSSFKGQEENYPLPKNEEQKVTDPNNTQCLNQCASGGIMGTGNLNNRCTPIAAFNNELNAQGLNCPMGNSGNMVGAIF